MGWSEDPDTWVPPRPTTEVSGRPPSLRSRSIGRRMPKQEDTDTVITIGIDESGTGAWAGPFTVGAVAGFTREADYYRKAGVRDSKTVSDKKRRQLCPVIAGLALSSYVSVVGVDRYNLGKQEAWRWGIQDALGTVLAELHSCGLDLRLGVVIDGSEDKPLREWVRSQQRKYSAILWTRFIPKADQKNMFVASASILAKTCRNDIMLDLHDEYPEYGWNSNYGYGGGPSHAHSAGLRTHGKTVHHRDMKPLRNTRIRP